MAKTNTDFHTIVLVDKSGEPIRSIRLKTKHVSRWKQYLALSACLFGLMASCLTFFSFKSTKADKETAALHSEIKNLRKALTEAHVKQASMPDSSQAKEYLTSIDEKLKRISLYMKKRGIRGFSALGVGGSTSKEEVASPEEMYALYDEYLGRLLSGVAFTPLGYPYYNRMTSVFGYRSDPFGNGRELHAGIDIRGRRGDPARATADGRVEHAGRYGGYGNCVIIKHGNGYQTLYGHLSKITVKKGEKVHVGERIGRIGSTGHSTGNHLHYEVRQNGRPINPVRFLNL